MSILATAILSTLHGTDLGALLANHLWQSTLFGAAAALITLALQKNSAHVRYSVWLAASLKFLLPFSLLTGLASRFAWHKAAALQQPVFVVVQRVSQPFSSVSTPQAPALAPSTFATLATLWPILLLVAWFCGCATVLFVWWTRWRRVMLPVRNALGESPRELEALRRVQARPPAMQVKLIVSQSALEPGIVGIFRPLLLLPAGIADRLSPAQLDAVITHELCHVRRRDNLAAALHMFVQALFWFHPFVWWIGARLLAERERACDEEVLMLGTERQSYAEGILKICEFYLESPLVCAAGVTGSNLKKRIEAIMTHHSPLKLQLTNKLLLAIAAVLAIFGPLVFGFTDPSRTEAQNQSSPAVLSAVQNVSIQVSHTPPEKESMSFRAQGPGNMLFTMQYRPVLDLITSAYGLDRSQIAGAPDWVASEKYDITATLLNAHAPSDPRQSMPVLQTLLAQRFGLKFHREIQNQPVYELVVAKDGTKMMPVPQAEQDNLHYFSTNPPGQPQTHASAKHVSSALLAKYLSGVTGRLVLDKTGLARDYNFTLDWTATADNTIGDLLTVLPEQLGLELQPQTAPVGILVIDRIERPATDTSSAAHSQSAQPQSASASPSAVAVSFPSNSFASQTKSQAENPITCASGSVEYPEGTVIQMGDQPEQMCARTLNPPDPKHPDAPLKYSASWIHTSKMIRERSTTVVHVPEPPLVSCSPAASTQKNLCACEGAGDFSPGALVNSAKGSFQLRCKNGKWLQTKTPNIQRN
jgi:bla regulator protein blaR1